MGQIDCAETSRHGFGACGSAGAAIFLSAALSASESPCAPAQCASSRKAAARLRRLGAICVKRRNLGASCNRNQFNFTNGEMLEFSNRSSNVQERTVLPRRRIPFRAIARRDSSRRPRVRGESLPERPKSSPTRLLLPGISLDRAFVRSFPWLCAEVRLREPAQRSVF